MTLAVRIKAVGEPGERDLGQGGCGRRDPS